MVLTKNATLLKSTKRSQIMESKHKEVISGDEKEQWSSKKNKRKQPARYYKDTTVKMKNVNSCERYVSTGQDCLVYNSK